MATTQHSYMNGPNPDPRGGLYTCTQVLDLGKGTTYTLPATTGDILKIRGMPKGVTIGHGCALIFGDHDTGANLVVSLRIYDGTTAKYIIHQSSVGQTGGIAIPSKSPVTEDGIGYVIPTDGFDLELLIDTGAAGGAQAAIAKIQLELIGWITPGSVSW